ncbi:MAG TPA: 2-amino-4-hydroxy-6-hydroxymethyldihydropteridine diphosphokinase [Sphingomonas sp.]
MTPASRTTRYVVGLGSNRRHGRHGAPRAVLAAAVDALAAAGLGIVATSATHHTSALGPSDREFANSAVLLRTTLGPPDLLTMLKRIERAFGRRPGRRWGARVLDLDILAWSEGAWPPGPRRAPPGRLAIPHRALVVRGFAITPASRVAPRWRHPYLAATLSQLDHRRSRPVDRHRPGQ